MHHYNQPQILSLTPLIQNNKANYDSFNIFLGTWAPNFEVHAIGKLLSDCCIIKGNQLRIEDDPMEKVEVEQILVEIEDQEQND